MGICEKTPVDGSSLRISGRFRGTKQVLPSKRKTQLEKCHIKLLIEKSVTVPDAESDRQLVKLSSLSGQALIVGVLILVCWPLKI